MKLFESVDILIVGAGPVGCLVANLLGNSGKKVTILDMNPDILDIPRAIALDQDALRILQAVDALAGMEGKIPSINSIKMVSPTLGLLTEISSKGSIDCHPRLSTFSQPDLERLLRNNLKKFRSIQLVNQAKYISHSNRKDGSLDVLVEVNREKVTVITKYLLGCDGAKSQVRENMGWKLEGSTYREDWFILDTEDQDYPVKSVVFHCDPFLPISEIPGPGKTHRWEFLVKDNLSIEEVEKKGYLEKWMKRFGGLKDKKIIRKAIYRFHAKVSDRFGIKNVFLVGDACHLTPPFAGQGLVSGMRDAFNIYWKLLFKLDNGKAGDTILGTYEIERRPHAKKMIQLAVFMGSIIMTRNPLIALLRDSLFFLLNLTPLKRLFTEMKIKPKNKFKSGLFLKKGSKRFPSISPGEIFPQRVVLSQNGTFQLSDEILGRDLVIVGMADGFEFLKKTPEFQAWKQIGGKFAIARLPGQEIENPEADILFEDTESLFYNAFGREKLYALIRPDKIVGATFDQKSAQNTIRSYIDLLHG